MTCDACGRDFRQGRGLTCPWCGYNNGAGPAPRTEASIRSREWWRKRREEEDQAVQELLDLRRDD